MKKLSLSVLALMLVSALFVGCKEDGGTASEEPTFSVPAQTIETAPGETTSVSIEAKPVNGFTGEVTFQIQPKEGFAVTPKPGATGMIAVYNVVVSPTVPVGTYTLNVIAKSGDKTVNSAITVTVVENPNAVAVFIASATDTLWGPVGTSVEVTYVAKNASGGTIAKSVLDGLGKTLDVTKTGVRPNSVTITDVSTSDSYKLKLEFTGQSSDTLIETPENVVLISASLDGKVADVKAVGVSDFTQLNWGKKGTISGDVIFTQNGRNINVAYSGGYPLMLNNLKITKNHIVDNLNDLKFFAVTSNFPTKIIGKDSGGSTWVYEKK